MSTAELIRELIAVLVPLIVQLIRIFFLTGVSAEPQAMSSELQRQREIMLRSLQELKDLIDQMENAERA